MVTWRWLSWAKWRDFGQNWTTAWGWKGQSTKMHFWFWSIIKVVIVSSLEKGPRNADIGPYVASVTEPKGQEPVPSEKKISLFSDPKIEKSLLWGLLWGNGAKKLTKKFFALNLIFFDMDTWRTLSWAKWCHFGQDWATSWGGKCQSTKKHLWFWSRTKVVFLNSLEKGPRNADIRPYKASVTEPKGQEPVPSEKKFSLFSDLKIEKCLLWGLLWGNGAKKLTQNFFAQNLRFFDMVTWRTLAWAKWCDFGQDWTTSWGGNVSQPKSTFGFEAEQRWFCLLYTSPSPRD